MKALAALAAVAALVAPVAAHAFANTEPLAGKQWYLEQDAAWDYWPSMPSLFPVKVAVIDTGIDGTHPELAGRVVAARSFVGGSPFHDDQGHGTFVAGLIAANPTNGLGIAGLAFNARLVVAKVVTADGSISLRGEVAAIRWAADQGARVINLSLGGVRDPLDASNDTYSPLEQAAVDYAYSKGAVVVAAVGNGTQAPATPWRYADYPAALPHVIGVSALRRDDSVPDYSNRDAIYNDLAAYGDSIFSTIPTNLVAAGNPDCANEPYSDCGPAEFRGAIGTSFSAPQVSAAAALLLGQFPDLRPEQVAYALERSARDLGAPGRDALTGWGGLDVAAALTLANDGGLPAPDRYEPNDDAGPWSHALPPLPRTVTASLDYWDDDRDVYRVTLREGQKLYVRLTPASRARVRVELWAPGTEHVARIDTGNVRVAQSRRVGLQQRLVHRASTAGTYYLAVKLGAPTRDPVQYRLALSRS